MRIQWQDYDDQMFFEVVLKKIREKQLTNVTVSFKENMGRIHYELEADVCDGDIARALGFREPPR